MKQRLFFTSLRAICAAFVPIITEGKMSFPGKAIQRTWHLIDASSQTVGRIATTVAPLLKGKHKPTYRPNGDCGDVVVIVNAEKVNDWTLCQKATLECV